MVIEGALVASIARQLALTWQATIRTGISGELEYFYYARDISGVNCRREARSE